MPASITDVGEIAALLRDKTVLSDNGDTVRRRLALRYLCHHELAASWPSE